MYVIWYTYHTIHMKITNNDNLNLVCKECGKECEHLGSQQARLASNRQSQILQLN